MKETNIKFINYFNKNINYYSSKLFKYPRENCILYYSYSDGMKAEDLGSFILNFKEKKIETFIPSENVFNDIFCPNENIMYLLSGNVLNEIDLNTKKILRSRHGNFGRTTDKIFYLNKDYLGISNLGSQTFILFNINKWIEEKKIKVFNPDLYYKNNYNNFVTLSGYTETDKITGLDFRLSEIKRLNFDYRLVETKKIKQGRFPVFFEDKIFYVTDEETIICYDANNFQILNESTKLGIFRLSGVDKENKYLIGDGQRSELLLIDINTLKVKERKNMKLELIDNFIYLDNNTFIIMNREKPEFKVLEW